MRPPVSANEPCRRSFSIVTRSVPARLCSRVWPGATASPPGVSVPGATGAPGAPSADGDTVSPIGAGCWRWASLIRGNS